MIIDVLSLFPQMFTPVIEESILGRAASNDIVDIRLCDIRDYAVNKHRRTDDTPYGGGAGMIMCADPVFRALESMDGKTGRVIYMSPKGRLLNTDLIKELSGEDHLTLLCGRYEGIDERIIEYWHMDEITIGDYILTGGELPAMVLIDAVVRMLPGVLGSSDSHREESIYSDLLEYPQYTKPREYRGMKVPETLLSGDHSRISTWRYEKSLILTKTRRPDLFKAYLNKDKSLNKREKEILNRVTEYTIP